MQIVYFKHYETFSDYSQRIQNLSYFTRFLKSMKGEFSNFKDTITLDKNNDIPIISECPAIDEKIFGSIQSDFVGWSCNQIYNEFISIFLGYIDEVVHMEDTLVELGNKDSNVVILDGSQVLPERAKNLKNSFMKKRKTTALEKKLNDMIGYGYILREDKDIIEKLYYSRNAIAHWFGHVNPVSYRSNLNEFDVLIPKFKFVSFTKLETEQRSNLNIKDNNNATGLAEIQFYTKRLKEGEVIQISFDDLVIFHLWLVNLFYSIYSKISEKRPPVDPEKLEEVLHTAKKNNDDDVS